MVLPRLPVSTLEGTRTATWCPFRGGRNLEGMLARGWLRRRDSQLHGGEESPLGFPARLSAVDGRGRRKSHVKNRWRACRNRVVRQFQAPRPNSKRGSDLGKQGVGRQGIEP